MDLVIIAALVYKSGRYSCHRKGVKNNMLTEEQKLAFERDGFIVIRSLFDEAEIRRIA